jgi:hypothetical protein
MQLKMFSKFYPPLTLVAVMATANTIIIITVIIIAVVTALKT